MERFDKKLWPKTCLEFIFNNQTPFNFWKKKVETKLVFLTIASEPRVHLKGFLEEKSIIVVLWGSVEIPIHLVLSFSSTNIGSQPNITNRNKTFSLSYQLRKIFTQSISSWISSFIQKIKPRCKNYRSSVLNCGKRFPLFHIQKVKVTFEYCFQKFGKLN